MRRHGIEPSGSAAIPRNHCMSGQFIIKSLNIGRTHERSLTRTRALSVKGLTITSVPAILTTRVNVLQTVACFRLLPLLRRGVGLTPPMGKEIPHEYRRQSARRARHVPGLGALTPVRQVRTQAPLLPMPRGEGRLLRLTTRSKRRAQTRTRRPHRAAHCAACGRSAHTRR